MQALSRLCPSVTVECGRVAQERGARHAASYVEACLRLLEIPEHPVPEHDIDLFHTVGIARMKSGVTFSFGETGADVSFRDDLDRLNFRELPPGTVLGRVKPGRRGVVEVSDESGREVADHYLALRDGKLTTTVPLTPSMPRRCARTASAISWNGWDQMGSALDSALLFLVLTITPGHESRADPI